MTFLCLQRVGVKKELGEGGPSCPLHDWKAILSTLCEIPFRDTLYDLQKNSRDHEASPGLEQEQDLKS